MTLKFRESSDILEIGTVIVGDKTWSIFHQDEETGALSIYQHILPGRAQDEASAQLSGKIFLVTKVEKVEKTPNDYVRNTLFLKELDPETFEPKEDGLSLTFKQASWAPCVDRTKIVGFKKPMPIVPVEQTFDKFEPVV